MMARLNDGKSTQNTLRDVRGMGVRIALENFGASIHRWGI
jgi:EAL domain-containing protein (putative c-di-GMP-specific phosphodiesterase class I)